MTYRIGEHVKLIATVTTVCIWSGEHRAWWKSRAAGYMSDPARAGRFLIEEALRLTSNVGPEKKIRIENPPLVPEERATLD